MGLFSKKWQDLKDEEFEDLKTSELAFYETFIAAGNKFVLKEDGKWDVVNSAGVVTETDFKDETKLRKAFIPRYLYDLSATWRLMPLTNTVPFYWTIMPELHGYSVTMYYRGTNRKVKVYGETPEFAILRAFWTYKS